RKLFINPFIEIFNKHYQHLTNDTEPVELVYESQLFENRFVDLLNNTLSKDRALERTTTGIHKDDLLFTIHGMPLKKFGSQGQQKSFLIALKLAQYSFQHEKKGFKPLLLLDDIFDKLDELRITKLMQMVSHQDFGQIFITDTSRQRVERIFEEIGVSLTLFEIEKGSVKNHGPE